MSSYTSIETFNIGIKKNNKTLVKKYLFKNKKRNSIQNATVNKALNLILSFIK